MNLVPQQLGMFQGVFDPNNIGRDTTVVIACNDIHIVATDLNAPPPTAPGDPPPPQHVPFLAWRDAVFNVNFAMNGPVRKCAQLGSISYTYETRLPAGTNAPHHVIVLCDDTDPNNHNNRAALTNFPIVGIEWRLEDWGNPIYDFDVLNLYTSNTVLHEAMHALAPHVVIGATLPGMPANSNGERYLWSDITALPANVKNTNAQGYSMLGTALWMRYHTLTAGNMQHQGQGAFGRRYNFNNRPGQGPHASP
jgi:hypothetical protein